MIRLVRSLPPVVAALLLGVSCGASDADQLQVVDESALEPIVITAEDLDWYPHDPAIMTEAEPGDDERYEEPPIQFCENGDELAMVADNDLFTLLDDDAWVWVGEWVTGERADAAEKRVKNGVASIEACGEKWRRVDLVRPDLDEVYRYEIVEDGEPVGLDLVYARNGGVIVMLYLDGDEIDWKDDKKESAVVIALDRLAAAGRIEVAS
jgi:hypothetical protein